MAADWPTMLCLRVRDKKKKQTRKTLENVKAALAVSYIIRKTINIFLNFPITSSDFHALILKVAAEI